MTITLLKEAAKLPVLDRLELVEAIWDTFPADAASIPLTVEQKRELDRRLDAMEKDPARGLNWKDARQRIRIRK